MRPLFLLLSLAVLATPLARAAVVTPEVLYPYLAHWEGVRTRPYPDVGGGFTVGLGHHLSLAEDPQGHYSHAQVLSLYRHDYRAAVRAATRAIPHFGDLPRGAQIAVLSLAWTTGATGLLEWTTLRRALERRDYDGAARALLSSSRGHLLHGRTLEEASLLRSCIPSHPLFP